MKIPTVNVNAYQVYNCQFVDPGVNDDVLFTHCPFFSL